MFARFKHKSHQTHPDPIIILGGGAGGLELATQLGNYYRYSEQKILLIDQNKRHVWKPLFHEVASGSLDADIDGVDYLAHSANHGFKFVQGTMTGLERDHKKINLAAITDDNGEQILPERTINYSLLVFALGSITNDFATQGAKQHCIFLDSCERAEYFNQHLMNSFLKLQASDTPDPLEIAIVGAGATGVELAAELFKTAELLRSYGYDNVTDNRLKITIIEASPRILGALPERIANAAQIELKKIGVEILTNTAITEVTSQGFITKQQTLIPASIRVWAAGVKAPDFLKDIGGLATNRINQLEVKPSLQTTLDDSIFAIGDCASYVMENGTRVPPRAQSAHQMATHVYKNIIALLRHKPLTTYVYRDYGSLVSLSSYSTVGNLMGNLTKGSMVIEGHIARLVYLALYRMHQIALHGYRKTFLMMLVGRLNRRLRPYLKLH